MSAGPVWINGSLTGAIDPSDRGLLLGDGVFDTLVAFGGVPFAGAKHLERLVGHAGAIGIPLDAERVLAGWEAVLVRAGGGEFILRTTVTRGVAGRGLWPNAPSVPTVLVSAAPWSPQLYGQPARLVTSLIRRNPSSPAARLKTLAYLDNILAAREAAERGADDALLLTPAGYVACSTIANVFGVWRDRIATPPLEDGVMPGIMRRMVLDCAGKLGLGATEEPLTTQDLASADAVFLTNSVRFLCPVVSLDGRPTSTVAASPLRAIAAAVAEEVRRECRFELPALPSQFEPGGRNGKLDVSRVGYAG